MRDAGGSLREGMALYAADGSLLGGIRSWGSSVAVVEDEHGRPMTIPLDRIEVTTQGARLVGDADFEVDAVADEDETPTVTLERAEEQLRAEKVQRRSGTVRIARETVEEREQVQVTLAHDEVRIERTPADRPLEDEAPVATEGQATRILVVEERLEVRKVPWVVEEIRVFRGIRREAREITDTVRKERIRIDPEGDVRIRDDNGGAERATPTNEETTS
jgi:uncharacterized protein (TIGR02271 family)